MDYLNYELDRLEAITGYFRCPNGFTNPSLFDAEAELKTELRKEVEKIKKNLIREVFAIEDQDRIQLYVQFHQMDLIRIMDMLDTSQSKPEEQNHNSPTILFALETIGDLLDFIERHFAQYFKLDAKAPSSYVAREGSDFVIVLRQFQKQFDALQADSNLSYLALLPIAKFIEQIPSGTITYRKTIYVKEVVKELKKIVVVAKNNTVDEYLRSVFVYLNYNVILYFNYYTLYLAGQINKADDSREKIEKLSLMLKSINQTPVKQGATFNFRNSNLKEQLVEWIGEEIHYHERVYQFNQKQTQSQGPITDTFRLQLDFSLSQLAFFVKTLVECKIIKNSNAMDVLRFLSRFCQVRTQDIIYESFRVRYYNAEDSIRKSVRGVLLQLVDYINKT